MQISDNDIMIMDECEVDCSVLNATRVNILSQGVTLHSIRVKGVAEGYTLVGKLYAYQEELNETKKK